jgi:hypothetical protein
MIQEKLIDIQQKLKAPKGQFNSFGKYKYRSAEDILEAVKPLLGEFKVSLILSDEIVNLGTRYYIKATARLVDGQDFMEAYGYAREEETKKGMDGSQITGASSSYARKYALNGLLAIDDNKDSDSTNKHDSKDDAITTKIKNAKTEKELGVIYSELTEEQQPIYVGELAKRKQELRK